MALGCATLDPVRRILRECPIDYVEGEKAARAALAGPAWQGGAVLVMGECAFDAPAVSSWANSNGIPCEVVPVDVRVRRRWIPGGHVTASPVGSGKGIDFQFGVGLVARTLNKQIKGR